MGNAERIDARNIALKELFITLREILESKRGKDVFIEILIDTNSNAKKIKSFVAFSGCQSAINKKDGYFIIQITGIPCCV
jgi:hypothetical protein